MGRITCGLLAALSVLALPSVAGATGQRTPLMPPVLPEDFSSGWYSRADFGLVLPGSSSPVFVAPGVAQAFAGARVTEGGAMAGLGIGFKYKSFRTDITIDTRLGGMLTSAGGLTVASTIPMPSALSARSTTTSALWNLYWDIATVGGFSPYLGIGMGAAVQSARGYPVVGQVPALFSGQRFGFAWSLMAGFAADLTPQVKIDFGYRYLQPGTARFAEMSGNGGRVLLGGAAHELRVGLRYMFN